MGLYRKKPVVIEAMKVENQNYDAIEIIYESVTNGMALAGSLTRLNRDLIYYDAADNGTNKTNFINACLALV